MSTRDDNARKVAALKAEGLNGLQIAARLGLSRSYTYELINDPEGREVRARKESYRGTCPECGGKTDGSNGPGTTVELCRRCRTWTPEEALAACRTYFAREGRSPCCGTDGLPVNSVAVRLFGGWNEMLLTADLPLNTDRRESTHERILALFAEGRTALEVAATVGLSPGDIYMRLRYRGLTVEEVGGFSPAAQHRRDREVIQRMYHEGATYAEIAAAIGIAPASLGQRIRTMRELGYDLPYRRELKAA